MFCSQPQHGWRVIMNLKTTVVKPSETSPSSPPQAKKRMANFLCGVLDIEGRRWHDFLTPG